MPGTCHEIAEGTIGFLTTSKLRLHLGHELRPQRQVAGAKQKLDPYATVALPPNQKHMLIHIIPILSYTWCAFHLFFGLPAPGKNQHIPYR